MELSPRFRKVLATAFTILAVTGGLMVLSQSSEIFMLGLMASGILVGRELILRGPGGSPELAAGRGATAPALPQGVAAQQELAGLRDRIRQAVGAREMTELLAGPLEEVERLVEIHGRLALEQAGYAQHLAEHPVAEIDAELQGLEHKLANAADETRALYAQNIDVLRLRRAKLASLQSSMEVARAQRRVIEDSLKLFYDQMLVSASPDDLREPLARLTTNLRATEAILAETRGLVSLPQLG